MLVRASAMYAVEDASAQTLGTLCALLEESTELEHFVYREAELDDLWRNVDTAIEALRRATATQTPELKRYETLREIVMNAHNAVGRDEDPLQAARLLRAGLAYCEHRSA